MKIKYIYFISTLVFFFTSCNNRSGKEYKDIESLLSSIKKENSVEYDKLPPRLVKVFLRYDNSDTEGMEELLGMSKLFIVVHIPKKTENSYYKVAYDEVRYLIKKNVYDELINLEIDKTKFREFYLKGDELMNEIVLEIDEPNLYTIYCLKGDFTKSDIEKVSKQVSPIDFLKLNQKIRKK